MSRPSMKMDLPQNEAEGKTVFKSIALCEVLADSIQMSAEQGKGEEVYALTTIAFQQIGITFPPLANPAKPEGWHKVVEAEQGRFIERLKESRLRKRESRGRHGTVTGQSQDSHKTVTRQSRDSHKVVTGQSQDSHGTPPRLSCPSNSNSISTSASDSKKTEAEEKEAFRPSVSVSVYKGELSYSAFKNPDNDPVSLAMALCEVEDLRNRNTLKKLLRTKGENVFREELASFFAEIHQGEEVDNRAAALTKRLNQYPDKTDEPKPSKPPANRTETDKPTALQEAQTLARGLFNHPRQANGSQAEASGLEAELLRYADANGITETNGRECASTLVELSGLGHGEALSKLPTRAKYAFACRYKDADEEDRQDLLAKLADKPNKRDSTTPSADMGEEMPF